MDSLVSRYKDKLATFRIKELKDVLGHIGIAKQGRKQVLMDRIVAVLAACDQQGYKSNGCGKKHVVGREEVAKVIDDIFSKIHGSGPPELTSKIRNCPNSHAIVPADEFEESAVPEARTRCPCGSTMDHDTMIQCDESKCGVWQHLACVVTENLIEGFQPEVPPQHYCEMCRINRSDPFCVTVAQPLYSTKLTISMMTVEGPSPLQATEKTFILTKAERDLLQKPGYDLQAWCLLLNDKVPFRMHWPQNADLRVNGITVWVTNRQGPHLLGINGRDDGPEIKTYSIEGSNRISLSAYDARPFCLGVRIIHHRTVEQVLSLVPSQSEGELFEQALARVKRCIGGGTSVGNSDDNDSDLEVVAESVSVNLRCPLSGSRISVAGRFKPCDHMGCFDLNTFLELNQRAKKWQCPICLKNYSLENIIIDPYFNRITSRIKGYSEDVTEVEVKPDGCWRPKHDGKNKILEQWHLPDGSIDMKNQDVKSHQVIPKKVKQEGGVSEDRVTLNIGIKRNWHYKWEVSGTKNIQSSGANNMSCVNDKQKLEIMPHNSSATASNRLDEDESVNQEASWNLDFSANNDADIDSVSLGNVHPTSKVVKPIHSQPPNEAEIILLSDSEEEKGDDPNIGSSTTSVYVGSDNHGPGGLLRLNCHEALPEDPQVDCNGIPFVPASSSVLPGSFCEVNSLPGNVNPPLDLFGGSGEFGLSHWPVHAQNPTFQFGENEDVPAITANSWYDSATHPTAFNLYGVDPQQQDNRLFGSRISEYSHAFHSQPGYLNTQADDGLNDNLRGIGSADVPLQFFLPPQPEQVAIEGDRMESSITLNDAVQTDWISLGLGSGNSLAEAHSRKSADALHDRPQSAHGRGRLDSLANTASVLLNMSNNTTQLASVDNRGSDEHSFSPHQRPHSVRPQSYLPIDSDSD
eukprot:Gb_39446 [translate_table: standard]